MSLWQNGTNLDGSPQRFWETFDFSLSGSNFNLITETNNPDFNTSIGSFGPTGLPAYSRMATIGVGVDDDSPVLPVDPLEPDKEVNPENPPELPEYQGLVSIDFVSQLNFGVQEISAQERKYFASPQRLLDGQGNVLENEDRPNYIQISDRRAPADQGGWTLSVTQEDPFKNDETKNSEGLN